MDQDKEKLVNRALKTLQREYTVISRIHIHAWHAWLVLGVMAGSVVGVLFVANRSGEFSFSEAAKKQLPSDLQIVAIDLKPKPEYNTDLSRVFPNGQMFDLNVSMLDNSSNTDLSVPKIKIKIFQNGDRLATIALQCEKTGSTVLCRDGIWNATNVQMGSLFYDIEVSGKDNLGNTISQIRNLQLSFKEVDLALCKELIPGHNKQRANRANIIFVGAGYDNVESKSPSEALALIANTVVDIKGKNSGLFSVKPFRNNKNKFNFWYVTQFVSLTDCDTPSGKCPSVTFVPLAENCPYGNKYVVNVIDKSEGQETGAGERMVSYGFPLSPNLRFDPNVVSRIFVHEFGHAFGELADEYVLFPDQSYDYETSSSIFARRRNVYAGPQHTQKECLENAPWKNIIGNGCGRNKIIDCQPENPNYNLEIGCFEGAVKVGKGIFRPTRHSIMNNHNLDPYSFGSWNEYLIQGVLKQLQ